MIERKVGLSIPLREGVTLLDACREGKVDCVEISVRNPGEAVDLGAYVRAARERGVWVRSMHLPFWEVGSISVWEDVRDGRLLETQATLMARAAEAGVRLFVIHPSKEPIADGDRGEQMKCARESLARLAEKAAALDSLLCVEDLPRTCLGRDISDMRQLLSADPRLRLVFDTNHLLGGETQRDFLLAFPDRLETLHVSDYDFVNERHWLPGEGKIDWVTFLDTLDEIGYTGPLVYEVDLKCPRTIYRDRDLTPADIYANAMALVRREKPAVLSRPKPGIGMWE